MLEYQTLPVDQASALHAAGFSTNALQEAVFAF